MGVTFTRLKGSGDLRSMERSALADYVKTLASPPEGAARPELGAKIARGKAIFHSPAAECSTCHSGPHATDNEQHDVQSKVGADKGSYFNTPSLRLVGGGGPYFHDGRYKTLHQLLTDTDRKMGHTAQLVDRRPRGARRRTLRSLYRRAPRVALRRGGGAGHRGVVRRSSARDHCDVL